MGIIDIARGRTDETTPETDVAEDADQEQGGGRRWPLVLATLVVVGAVLYLRSRQRAAREAEFTEIELDPAESESESESASTE